MLASIRPITPGLNSDDRVLQLFHPAGRSTTGDGTADVLTPAYIASFALCEEIGTECAARSDESVRLRLLVADDDRARDIWEAAMATTR